MGLRRSCEAAIVLAIVGVDRLAFKRQACAPHATVTAVTVAADRGHSGQRLGRISRGDIVYAGRVVRRWVIRDDLFMPSMFTARRLCRVIRGAIVLVIEIGMTVKLAILQALVLVLVLILVLFLILTLK